MNEVSDAALTARLAVARRVATEAGKLALAMRPASGAPVATLKGAQDWLTEADGAVERLLADELARAFPEDGFLGEEGGRRTGALTWVVDPIDGTSNYARGSSRFCVSLGLMAGPLPLLGVVVAPALGETYVGVRGRGATCNGARIHAATTAALARGMVEIGWSRRRPEAAFQALLAAVMATDAALRLGGSGTLGLMDVAAGRTDAYAELHINLWDVAAGLAILAEAGAFISPFTAGHGMTHGNPILAAAPGIAALLEDAIGAVLARPPGSWGGG